MVYESRTHKLLREREERASQQEPTDDLEADLEASERNALRLAKELLDETTLRVRAEKNRTDLEQRVEILTEQIAEMEQKLDERVGRPKRITRKEPVTSRPKEEEDPPTSLSGEPSVRRSSRVRGGVK